LYKFGELVRFGLVGIANNIVGLLVIYVALILGFSPIAANVSGYTIGLVTSYFGNQKFTFSRSRNGSNKIAFIVSFCLAYSLNLIVLIATRKLEVVHALLPQVLALGTYSVFFFVLMKFWVFRARKSTSR
jgi:putative flippase GtrA